MKNFSFKPIKSLDDDRLGYKRYVEAFARRLKYADNNSVAAVYGAWGQGKTSFIQMVKDYVEGEGEKEFGNYKVIFIPLLDFERIADDITYNLAQQIADKSATPIDKVLTRFKTYGEQAVTALSIIVRSLELELLKGVKFSVEESAEDMMKLTEEIRKNYLLHSTNHKMQELKKLNDIAGIFRSKKKNLIICFDDLDRCEPSTSRLLLEELKIFFNKLECKFVLAINPDILKQSIKAYYKTHNFDDPEGLALTYFDKFIDYHVTLPVINIRHINEFIGNIVSNENVILIDSELYVTLLGIPLNPRAVRKYLFSLQYVKDANNDETGSDISAKRAKIHLMKLFYPSIVDFALKHRDSYEILITKCNVTSEILKYDCDETAIRRVRELRGRPVENDSHLSKLMTWIDLYYPHLYGFLRSEPILKFDDYIL